MTAIDDPPRVLRALCDEVAAVCRALICVPRPLWGRDDRFLDWVTRLPPDQMSDAQRDHLLRCAWRLRRYLPPHLAPKVNPDDPVVREERAAAWRAALPAKETVDA